MGRDTGKRHYQYGHEYLKAHESKRLSRQVEGVEAAGPPKSQKKKHKKDDK